MVCSSQRLPRWLELGVCAVSDNSKRSLFSHHFAALKNPIFTVFWWSPLNCVGITMILCTLTSHWNLTGFWDPHKTSYRTNQVGLYMYSTYLIIKWNNLLIENTTKRSKSACVTCFYKTVIFHITTGYRCASCYDLGQTRTLYADWIN